jgi:hypothetical protein
MGNTNTVLIWTKVKKTDSCWLWTGSYNNKGYASATLDGIHGAHRIIYTLTVGPIPDGMQVDHLCRNRGCVNPDHMQIVTPRENTLTRTNAYAHSRTQSTERQDALSTRPRVRRREPHRVVRRKEAMPHLSHREPSSWTRGDDPQ